MARVFCGFGDLVSVCLCFGFDCLMVLILKLKCFWYCVFGVQVAVLVAALRPIPCGIWCLGFLVCGGLCGLVV